MYTCMVHVDAAYRCFCDGEDPTLFRNLISLSLLTGKKNSWTQHALFLVEEKKIKGVFGKLCNYVKRERRGYVYYY